MKKTHYVYKLTHTETGEYYWGSRTCEGDPEQDPYMGSMKKWKPDRSKLIKKIHLKFGTRKKALLIEGWLQARDFNDPLNRNGNIQKTGWTTYGMKMSQETREKMSESNSGDRNGFYGKKHSEETRKKIGEANKGKFLKKETKENIRKSMTGKRLGEKHPLFGKSGDKSATYTGLDKKVFAAVEMLLKGEVRITHSLIRQTIQTSTDPSIGRIINRTPDLKEKIRIHNLNKGL